MNLYLVFVPSSNELVGLAVSVLLVSL